MFVNVDNSSVTTRTGHLPFLPRRVNIMSIRKLCFPPSIKVSKPGVKCDVFACVALVFPAVHRFQYLFVDIKRAEGNHAR